MTLPRLIFEHLKSLVVAIFIIWLIGNCIDAFIPKPTEESMQKLMQQTMSELDRKSYAELDNETWVIVSRAKNVSGVPIKYVYLQPANRTGGIVSAFTNTEYAIGTEVIVGRIIHRMSETGTVEFLLVLIPNAVAR